MKKHISVSRLMDFMRCPKAYHGNITRARDRKVPESEVIGDVTHKLTAGQGQAAARVFVQAKLAHLPEERQEAVLEQAVELSANAVEMSAPEVTNERREVQLMWEDPITGYEIYAKPDELFFFDEVDERFGRRRVKSVMQITDVKAQAEEVKSYHWRQLYLFGLIATLSLRYYHAIRLVVRLAATESEEQRWFSQQATYRQLERLRMTLREIDQAWRTRVFEEKPGRFCKDCPLLAECAKGQEFLRNRENEARQFGFGNETATNAEGQDNLTRFSLKVVPSNQACA